MKEKQPLLVGGQKFSVSCYADRLVLILISPRCCFSLHVLSAIPQRAGPACQCTLRVQALVEQHARRHSKRDDSGTDAAYAQPAEGMTATAAAILASAGPIADSAAARGAAKAEKRRQAQGKQSRRHALQTRAKA